VSLFTKIKVVLLVLSYTDEREEIQKKTFTKWLNARLTSHGAQPISELFDDLRDGSLLLRLLEILTGIPLVSHSHILFGLPTSFKVIFPLFRTYLKRQLILERR